MKTALKMIIILCLTMIVAIAGYYAVGIYKARGYTESAVKPYLRLESLALDLRDMTERQLNILLLVEDPAFFEHNGMDLSTPGAGMTSITQSLVKLLYFKKFKPGIAKIKQTLIAVFALDSLISKEDQLRLFINHVELGGDTKGFEAAARKIFGKPFKALTEDEYIALVAMIIAPRTFDVERYPKRNAERVERIKRLVAGEYRPKGLCDLYYGRMDKEVQKYLPPFSYFDSYYEESK